MLPGSDLRKYRKKLGLSQHQVARLLGVSQASLSMIESGKFAISSGLHAKIEKVFNKAPYSPKYSSFCRKVEAERQSQQSLVGHPEVTFQILPVWEWEDGFDLSAAPSSIQPSGLVATRVTAEGAIAFQMPGGSAWWVEGEILVFAKSDLDRCRTGDLCLVQIRPPRARSARTSLVVVRFGDSGRSGRLELEPTDRSQPSYSPDPDQLEGLLRCVYRARYME